MTENQHHHHTTKIYETMHLFEGRNEDRIQQVIGKLSKENHIKPNEMKKNTFSHYLKTDKEYNELSKEKQARYVLDFFRSEAGYALIHEMFLAHKDNFKGIIDLYHNKEVKKILESYGISGELRQQRDRDLIRFLEDIYINLASYFVKFHKSDPPYGPPTQQHEYSHDEIMSFHLMMGYLKSDKVLENLYKIMNDQ